MIMQTIRPFELRSAATAYVLSSLSPADFGRHGALAELPASTLISTERNALVSATTASAPVFRDALKAVAAELAYDAVLIRLIHDNADLVEAVADVTLAALPCTPWSMHDLALWAGPEGALWLVPPLFGPAVSVSAEGLTLELLPPYATMAERTTGVFRAAGALAGLLRPATVKAL